MRGRSDSLTWKKAFAAGLLLRPILIVPMAPSGPLGGSDMLPIGLASVFALSVLIAAFVFVGNRPAIAILAEMDALPGIGHACGHNLIGTAAVGAGLGVAAIADELPGSVVILGCPAEESAVDDSGGLLAKSQIEDVGIMVFDEFL